LWGKAGLSAMILAGINAYWHRAMFPLKQNRCKRKSSPDGATRGV
jgi:hypothetical protein